MSYVNENKWENIGCVTTYILSLINLPSVSLTLKKSFIFKMHIFN